MSLPGRFACVVECGTPDCRAPVEWVTLIAAERARCGWHLGTSSDEPSAQDLWDTRVPEMFRGVDVDTYDPVIAAQARTWIERGGQNVDGGRAVVLFGPPRIGKTRLAYGLINGLVAGGHLDPRKVKFGTEAQILGPIADAPPWNQNQAMRSQLLSSSLQMLMIDDVGWAGLGPDQRQRFFHQLLDWLLTMSPSTRLILTTNAHDPRELAQLLSTPAMGRLGELAGDSCWRPGDYNFSTGKPYMI